MSIAVVACECRGESLSYQDEAKRRIEAFKTSLSDESDRGLVLVGGAFLEKELEELLRVYLTFGRSTLTPTSETTKELEKTSNSLFSFQGGPLATFTGKLNLTYVSGLLEQYEFNSLNRFIKLRNKFAHEIESNSLDSPQVIDLVKNFLESKRITREAVIERTSRLAYQIITRVLIFNQNGLGTEEKRRALGFAKGDPFNFTRKP